MARTKADLMWVFGSWLITIVVILLVFMFNTKRDMIDYLLIAAMIFLSGRQTYKFMKK